MFLFFRVVPGVREGWVGYWSVDSERHSQVFCESLSCPAMSASNLRSVADPLT